MDGNHNVLVELRLCTKDSDESAVVIDEDDSLCVASSRGRREELEVEEDTLADEGGWGSSAGDMEIVVVSFANLTRQAWSVELSHQINISGGQVRKLCDGSLIQNELHCTVARVAKELMKLTSLSGTKNHFFGEVDRVGG